MPYRILCNGVQREDVKARLDLASGLLCFVPLHKIRYGIDAVFEARLKRVSHHQWQAARLHCRAQQGTQLQMWRFRHKREPYLRSLEQRWTLTTSGTALLP